MSAENPGTGAVGTELLFENDVVRVWAMRLEPGEASEHHRHYCDYVIAYCQPLDAEVQQGERRAAAQYDAGYVAYFPVGSDGSEVQRLTNAGGQAHCHFVIELVGKNELAPPASNARHAAR